MKRMTKTPWFSHVSKEINWKDRGRPITWQGWTFTIFYVILMFILWLPFLLNRSDKFYTFLLVFFILPYLLAVRLTSDTDKNPSGITNAKISRMLKEKRKNKMK